MGDPAVNLSPADAVRLLEEIHARPTVLSIAAAARRLDELATAVPHSTLRIAVLASFTVDPLIPAIRVASLRAGIRANVWCAPFGQVTGTLIQPGGALDGFQPEVVLIAARLTEMAPELYDGFAAEDDAGLASRISDGLDQLEAAIRTFRERSSAKLLIQGFERPDFVTSGLADFDAPGGQIDLWRVADARLRRIADAAGNGLVMDYDGLVARHGRTWNDPRMEFYGRIPIAAGHYWDYAAFVARHLRAMTGRTKKVIVLDADNTLWGGILGDDGVDGIQIGQDFPGNAFRRFQQRLLALQQRGIILCIASKNEPGSVEKALATHPEMVLRPEHFACVQVHWRPKPESVREIAATLNLGADSFVFLDDSAVECAMMREALPEVLSIQMPEDCTRYANVIASLDCFDQLKLSQEDRQRGAMYRAEAQRKTLQTATLDLPTFYRSLEMRLSVGIDDEQRVARSAQLTQRTNQFNMNTIRCTEDDIRRWIASPDHDVLTLGLADRFGDSGIVGMAVVEYRRSSAAIHLFMMSCRVLGRTVEQCFIKWIARRAVSRGCRELTAEYVETRKNKPFSRFYEQVGFVEASKDGDAGTSTWNCDLASYDMAIPDWMTIVEQEGQSAR